MCITSPNNCSNTLRTAQRPQIVISDERGLLLGTGGGVKKALPELGDAPFFHVNSDTIWIDGVKPNLARLADVLRSGRNGRASAAGSHDRQRRLFRTRRFRDGAGRCFAQARRAGNRALCLCGGRDPVARACSKMRRHGELSLTTLFDRAAQAGRLHGLRLEGLWMHVGTPEAIALAEAAIRKASSRRLNSSRKSVCFADARRKPQASSTSRPQRRSCRC